MQTTTSTFVIHALPEPMLRELRENGLDASGYPVHEVVAGGGEPTRCCLRDAKPDETLLLFGYEAPLPPSPYREIGAVFAHKYADECEGPADCGRYPADWYGRAQVLRAYDERGWIHDATRVHDGHDPETVINEMLATAGVTQIHSRNVAYGCYMFRITKNTEADQ